MIVFDSYELGLIFSAMVDREGIDFDGLLRYSGRRVSDLFSFAFGGWHHRCYFYF